MKIKTLTTLAIICLSTSMSCAQENTTVEKISVKKQIPHNYGGWYCPDNLNGFPAVDITHWESVQVVNGRMATQKETQNGTALIFVDDEKYPNAKPLDIEMPKLARYFSNQSRKEEIVIIIQALNIDNDSIVGFRFLNGGNGSARMDEVRFLSDKEIGNISTSRFVSFTIDIDATKAKIWDVLTKQEYSKALQATFDGENKLKADWNNSSKVNFIYRHAGYITSEYAGNLYGNQYIQIDCELGDYQYVEKFLVSENEQANTSKLQIMCGPYGDDFNSQKLVLNSWAQKVKELSEKR